MSRPAVSPGHCTCPSGWAEIGRRGTRLNRKAALWLLPLLRRLSPPCSPSKRNSHGATGGAEGRTAQGGDLMSLPRDGGGTIYSDLSMQAAADHRWRKTGLGATTEGERKGGLLAGAARGHHRAAERARLCSRTAQRPPTAPSRSLGADGSGPSTAAALPLPSHGQSSAGTRTLRAARCQAPTALCKALPAAQISNPKLKENNHQGTQAALNLKELPPVTGILGLRPPVVQNSRHQTADTEQIFLALPVLLLGCVLKPSPFLNQRGLCLVPPYIRLPRL